MTGSLIAIVVVGAALVPVPGLSNAAEAGTTTGTHYFSDNLGAGVSDDLTYADFYCANGITGLATDSDNDGYFLDKLTVRCAGGETWSAWKGTGVNHDNIDWVDCRSAEENANSIIRGLRINARTKQVGAPDEIAAMCSINNSLHWLGDDRGDTFRPNVSKDGCPEDMVMDTIKIWHGTITAHNGVQVEGIANVAFSCSKQAAVS